MKNFIEVTCLDDKNTKYKRLVNMSYVFDVTPTSEMGYKSVICFAPYNSYEETYKYRIYVLESYDKIKELAEFQSLQSL